MTFSCRILGFENWVKNIFDSVLFFFDVKRRMSHQITWAWCGAIFNLKDSPGQKEKWKREKLEKNIVFLKELEILWREYRGQRRWWEEDHRGFRMGRTLKPISKCCRILMTIASFLMIQVWKKSEYFLYDENLIILKLLKLSPLYARNIKIFF